MPPEYGGVFHPLNEAGEKMPRPHPGDEDLARQVLRLICAETFNSQLDALWRSRKIGFLDDALCLIITFANLMQIGTRGMRGSAPSGISMRLGPSVNWSISHTRSARLAR